MFFTEQLHYIDAFATSWPVCLVIVGLTALGNVHLVVSSVDSCDDAFEGACDMYNLKNKPWFINMFPARRNAA